MFDPETVSLIASAPALDGLDLNNLPQELTEAYTQIVGARIRIRSLSADEPLPEDVFAAIQKMRRVASAHEAFVSVLPEREDRAAAAFVAGSAHHVCMLADEVRLGSEYRTRLGIESIPPEVSATILFLIAEASADAAEISKKIQPANEDAVERALLNALIDLAIGRLARISDSVLPPEDSLADGEPEVAATRSLYFLLLKGVRALAKEMLDDLDFFEPPALEIFERVKALAVDSIGDLLEGEGSRYSVFSGPLHLASLLAGVARDFPTSALVRVNPPGGVDATRWRSMMSQIATQRPYLWRNHREAVASGYLEVGVSAAVSFPTGAGKSKLAELKIAATLLRGSKAIFLAPTLALVDQTATSLAKTFPQAEIQRERSEELFTAQDSEPLPGISVFTPERCLSILSFTPDLFSDVGLIVFDECHLLHPRELDTSRRSIDAMLCLLNLTSAAEHADVLLLSAMMKNTTEIAGWVQELTGRSCLALDLKWKPTRQVRGCVVYESERLARLRQTIAERRSETQTVHPPAQLKREMRAQPFGFFCLRQTWVSNARRDYTLLPLLEDEITLGMGSRPIRNWYLTPNGNQVSAAIGAATSHENLKTLIFVQTIPLCKSTSKAVNAAAGTNHLQLLPDEIALHKMAVQEAGGASHLYAKISSDGILADTSLCHHGLLILQERQLYEELFRRPKGALCDGEIWTNIAPMDERGNAGGA